MGIYVDNDGFKEQKSKLDLISRQDAIDALMRSYEIYEGATIRTDMARRDELSAMIARLKSLPSAEPKTGAKIVPKEESDMYIAGYRDGHDDATKTGKWMQDDDYICDQCGYHMIVGGGAYNFCPNCGARMNKGGENE